MNLGKSILALAAALALTAVGSLPCAARDADPIACRGCNVILVSIDTLRADALGTYGNPRNTSSNMDRLAADGVVFLNAFSQFPHTFPSHMSIMTGQYPWVHKVRLTFHDHLSTSTLTLPMILKSNGYRTAWAAPTDDPSLELDAGFARGFDELLPPRDSRTDWTSRAFDWLKRHRREKFFLFLHTYRTHDPYTPANASVLRFRPVLDPIKSAPLPGPAEIMEGLKRDARGRGPSAIFSSEFLAEHPEIAQASNKESLLKAIERITKDPKNPAEMRFSLFNRGAEKFWLRFDVQNPQDLDYLRTLYDAAVSEADEGIGALAREIRKLDLSERTLLIITSDHGEEFMEHHNVTHHEDYIELTHVPLLVLLPGNRPARRRTEMVRGVDVMPTILDALGMDSPAGIQGMSLMPLIQGKDQPNRPREVFAQYYNSYSVRDARYTYIVKNRCYAWSAEFSAGCIAQELYDRSIDPREQNNLYASSPDLARHYLDLVTSRLEADGEPLEGSWLRWVGPDARRRLLKTGYW